MSSDSPLFQDLGKTVSSAAPRMQKLQRIAALIRESGGYRWVGLYEIDRQAGEVINLVWDGPGAPEYPRFPIGKGLTTSAIQERRLINVGDVAADPRYLTAFGSTRSEIIVPIFDAPQVEVVGTIDVESEQLNAFDRDTEKVLVACADVIALLWM
jgi:putative methionine-R-sulfoxide reductase with GAF domain